MLFITIVAYFFSVLLLVLLYRKDDDFIENIAISISLSNVLIILSLIIGGFFNE